MKRPIDLSDREATLVALVRRIADTDAMRFDVHRGRRLFESKRPPDESFGNDAQARGKAGLAGDGQREGVGRFLPRLPRRIVIHGALAAFAAVILTAAALLTGWRHRLGLLHRGLARASYTTYATTNGQRATITLPDGNAVVLNNASRIEVPTDYGAGHHVVRLPVGEALFSVTHHVGTPFTVVAEGITTRVLGTSFLVRHYREDTATTVVVVEGKVTVGSVIVTARQSADVDQHGVARLQAADESRFTFATGVLTLGVTSMAKAIPEFNRWYDADIRLGDPSLANREIEGRFIAGSLTDLAAILKLTLNVRVVRDGRVLTLYLR